MTDGDRAELSQILRGRQIQRFLLTVIALQSCTLQAIDCIRVLDNAAYCEKELDDLLVDRLFKNLESIFEALAGESIDESHIANLARCAEEISQLVEQLAVDRHPRAAAVTAAGQATPWTSAVRLTLVSVRVLPAAAQPRYAEEWQAELYELALSGASRWTQLIYALRILNEAWVLRAELKAPAPERIRP
ncbi:hypothetical protein [Paractinoplanes deccanensis]|uniref:hypothetical protein n=1 Tax=Paractinoplanes deccanensis TaxID=113561 RepID=UPI001EF399A1|nr:hypothetical protein [Actinoplanes deccanensis]